MSVIDRRDDAPARTAASRAYKNHRRLNGGVFCEVCGWWFPARAKGSACVEVHHILPRMVGGSHEFENLMLLCPNHHAIAHVVGACHNPARTFNCLIDTQADKTAYDGPRSRDDLIDAIEYAEQQAIAKVIHEPLPQEEPDGSEAE